MITAPATHGTFAELWQRAVDDHRGRTFLTFRSEHGEIDTWTYGEFDRIVQGAVALLTELTEVEAILAQAPGVLEVAVIARPDEIRDHVPVAYVVARDQLDPPTADALAAWASQQLAPRAWPREWHFIDSLPRTSVGKVRRFKIGTDTAS